MDEDKLEAAVSRWVDSLDMDAIVNIVYEQALTYYLDRADKEEVEEFIEAYGEH
jgi:trans-aconitate methyltransferase